MSKLVFPAIAATAYRGFLSEVRTRFQEIASWLEKSPQGATDLNAQIGVLAEATGYAPVLPATQTVVSNGQALTVPVTGTYTTTATVSVAGGVVTGIVLS